jgi:hypothetical protein
MSDKLVVYRKMLRAFNAMSVLICDDHQRKKLNTTLYEKIRTKCAVEHSKSLSGENHFNYGKNHSEETKKKISDSIKKHNKNHTSAWLGRFHTDESKQNMSFIKRGDKNPMFGKKYTKEEREIASLLKRGIPKTTEQKLNMQASALNRHKREQFTCRYCSKTMNKVNHDRWHDKNCKLNYEKPLNLSLLSLGLEKGCEFVCIEDS